MNCSEILCTRNSWQEVFIFIWTIKQFLTNANAIGFLVVGHQMWHTFRSDVVHLQCCGQNLVTRPRWYSTLFGKLPNGQTSISMQFVAPSGCSFYNPTSEKNTLYLKPCSSSTNEDTCDQKGAFWSTDLYEHSDIKWILLKPTRAA